MTSPAPAVYWTKILQGLERYLWSMGMIACRRKQLGEKLIWSRIPRSLRAGLEINEFFFRIQEIKCVE